MSEDRVDKWETRNGVTRASGVYSEEVNKKTQARQHKNFDVFRFDEEYDPDAPGYSDVWFHVKDGSEVSSLGNLRALLYSYEKRTFQETLLKRFRKEFPE